MKDLKTVLNESFYKNISHSDPLFKANLFLQEIIDMSKKVKNVGDMYGREINAMIPAGMCIAFSNDRDGVKEVIAHQDGSGSAQWQNFVKNHAHKNWIDHGWSFGSGVIDIIYNYIKDGVYKPEQIEVLKTDDVIPW